MKIQLNLLPDSVRRMRKTVEYCRERHLRPMLSNVTSALVALAMTIALNGPLLAATTEAPLVQKADLVYQGAFRVPQGSTDQATFNYGGTALGFNPINNSLFLTGHDWYQLTAELSIPSIVNSSNINNLNTATFLQPFTDETEGKLDNIDPTPANGVKVGGHLVYNNELIASGYSFYDGDNNQRSSHFTRPLSLSIIGQVVGPYLVGSDPHYTSGYMTLIPSEWQAAFGGPALTGMCCLAITSVQSNGPSVSVFDPSLTAQPATRLLGYPISNPLRNGSTTNAVYNLTSKVSGIVFPNGKRSVLFFGRHGAGAYCYGTGGASGGECYDPADESKGTHAYPYVYQVWAYDANDLLAVKNGAMQQYQPQPYAVWTFNLPFEGANMHFLGGAAYDPQTNRIYISQMDNDGPSPVIHAFTVQGGAPPTTLVPPTLLRVQ